MALRGARITQQKQCILELVAVLGKNREIKGLVSWLFWGLLGSPGVSCGLLGSPVASWGLMAFPQGFKPGSR